MTGLPPNGQPWPLPGNDHRFRRMVLPDAWYAGTTERLSAAYGSEAPIVKGGPPTTVNPRGGAQRVVNAIRNMFWSANPSTQPEIDTRRHLPLPEDIARHSARVLFSERLQIRVKGPTQESDGPLDASSGKPTWLKGDPTPETLAAQRRLDYLLSACKFDATLLASAETGSVLGSSGLRIAFNKTAIPDRPLLARVDADAMIPLYSWGQLVAVIFWAVVKHDTNSVTYRHLELHEGGKVYHGLYKGDGDHLGDRVELTAVPERPDIAALADLVDANGAITILPGGGTTATSIPNMLPDAQDRANNAGRSDFTPAVMDLFDSADRTYTQMMDAIDDAKSRIIVAASMLESQGAGNGVSFDLNQRIFTKVKVPPAEKEGGGLPLEKIQFEMHVAEYLQAIDAISKLAVEAAGYTARTDTGASGRDVTATEVNSDDALTLGTRDVKSRYWKPELDALLTSFVEVDVAEFNGRDPETGEAVQAFPVEVTFPDAIQPTMLELATVAKAVKDAAAGSTYELVHIVHPDWSDAQINTEVDRILSAASVIDPVSFGTAGAGVGPGDGA